MMILNTAHILRNYCVGLLHRDQYYSPAPAAAQGTSLLLLLSLLAAERVAPRHRTCCHTRVPHVMPNNRTPQQNPWE